MSLESKFEFILNFLLQGDGAEKAKKQLDDVDKSAKATADSTAKLKKEFTELLSSLAIEETLRRSVDAFIEMERAVAKLEGALRSSGQFSAAYSAELQAMAKGLSEVTTYSKDEILGLEASLVAFGAKKEDLKQFTMAVLDLATVLGRDLPSASQVMTAALSGEFGPAQRALRMQFDDNFNAAQNFERMLNRIAEISSGQATEAVKTLGGQYEIQKKQAKELGEELGRLAVGGVLAVANAFKGLGRAAHDAWVAAAGVGDGKFEGVIVSLEKMREHLDDLIKAQMELKKLSSEDAFFMDRQMASVMGRLRSGPVSPGEVEEANRTLIGISERLGVKVDSPRAGAPGSPGSGSLSSSGVHALEQEKQALLELGRLRAQLQTEGLEGIERERAEVMKRYQEERDQVMKLSNLAQESKDQETQRLNEVEAAKTRSLDLIEKRRQEALDKQSIEEMKAAEERAKAEMDLQEEITASQLKGQDLEVFTEEANHEKRLERIRSMQFENEDDYLKLIGLENQLHAVKSKNIDDQHDALVQFGNDMKEVGKQAEELFAHGLATTIVDAFTQGDVSFKKFAADFLKQIAEMIIQAEILLALRSIGLGLAGGGQVSAAALGGVFMAAGGYMGEVNSPTYLTKFNVLTGEAGREMLTVFAQPQLKTINGIAATVGNVGPRQMAVVAANDLAKATSGNSGAPGGSINITVQLAPGLIAGIVQNSVSNAKVAIAQDMQNDTQISRATKRLVA